MQVQRFMSILITRLAGLIPLVTSNCKEGDPREIRVNWDAEWASFVNPIVLIILFHVVIYEVKLLFSETTVSFCSILVEKIVHLKFLTN